MKEKTKRQLLAELTELHRRVAELEETEKSHSGIERALAESHQLPEQTLAGLRDAVFIINADTLEIMDCSRASLEMFGYTREDFLGHKTDSLHGTEVAAEEFRRHLSLAAEREGFVSRFESRMKRKDGTVFPTDHTVISVEGRQGERMCWVNVVRDITERKKAEEERGRLTKGLHEALAKVKTLRGLLPICAWCKKIRDDKGYWHQVEAYIRDRSDVRFSHALCPECESALVSEQSLTGRDKTQSCPEYPTRAARRG